MADTVTVDSRVDYRLDGMPPEARRLVAGGREMAGDTVPLATPVGVALLGLSAGAEIPIRLETGGFRSLSVIAVRYQPQHALRIGRPRPEARPGPPAQSSAAVLPFRRPAPPPGGGDDPGPSAA